MQPGEVDNERRLLGRIWASLVLVVTALFAATSHAADPPPDFAPLSDEHDPDSVFNVLDRIGALIGRAYRRLEAKLGLRSKDWPDQPT